MTVDPTPTSPSLKVWAGDHCPRSPSDSSSDQKSVKTKSSSDCLTSASSSPRLEPVGRSSFCSVREHDTDLAQALTSSKVSSYSTIKHSDDQGHDATHITQNEAIDDESSSDGDSTEVVFHPPRTHSHSKLREHLYPANSHWRRKQIKFRGRTKSPSYCDLQMLNAQRDPPYSDIQREKETAPGESRLERLPYELLKAIIDLLVVDIPTHGLSARNVDLMSLLLTSRTTHFATLNTLYSHVTIPHSKIFRKFLTRIQEGPGLGALVRRLDFCHFNPSTIFSTAKERASAVNLTSDTLAQCLELTTCLQEFLAQEYLDQDLDRRVLKKILFGLPRLQAVDFCGISSRSFKEEFTSLLCERWPPALSIRRVSMHKCLTLPHTVYEVLMPRLPRLTHLDVAGTQMSDIALLSIPHTAKLTHLNLAKCTRLSARVVIDFIAHHPAARELVFLSLAMDARSNQLLDVDDVTELIAVLPPTLKSLTLKGSKMDPIHIGMLRPHAKHLEELSLGRGVRLQDINQLFVPDETEEGGMEHSWVPHTLRYLDISDLAPADVDYSFLFSSRSAVLKRLSAPLEVVEVSDRVLDRFIQSSVALKWAGWMPKEFQSRSWLVRDASELGDHRDDGRRSWKWGATTWGMRKVPVALMDVGGMYGSFMYGRNL